LTVLGAGQGRGDDSSVDLKFDDGGGSLVDARVGLGHARDNFGDLDRLRGSLGRREEDESPMNPRVRSEVEEGTAGEVRVDETVGGVGSGGCGEVDGEFCRDRGENSRKCELFVRSKEGLIRLAEAVGWRRTIRCNRRSEEERGKRKEEVEGERGKGGNKAE
jgi:hypothetical protein